MTPKTCALVIWHVTMKSRQFFKTPYDGDGNPPRASLLYLITQIENMQERSAVSMPLALIGCPGFPSSVQTPAYSPRAAEHDLFGGGSRDAPSTITGSTGGNAISETDTFQNIIHKNSGVDARFKDLFQEVKGYYPFFRMGLVCQQSKDPQFRLRDILIKPDECLDYMAIGHCQNPRCPFQHTPRAKPDDASVPNFLAKVVPVLAQMIETGKQRAVDNKKKKRRRT
jgi:hypothetical protein